jgi:hypothetical protein
MDAVVAFIANGEATKPGKSVEILSVRMQESESPNWNLSPDGQYLAFTQVKLGEDAAIRILSMSDDSERTIPLNGWPVLTASIGQRTARALY